MILRSSLVQRREDVSSAEFSRYFREVHGPLAAKTPKTRAYKQNLRTRRWDLPEATFLPRVDAFSQMWFDDLHTMMESMNSPEQQETYADLTEISDSYIITVQEPGRLLGQEQRSGVKLALILAGEAVDASETETELYEFLDRNAADRFTLRVNRIIPTGDSTPVTPGLAAFAEVWVQEDRVTQELLNAGLLVSTGPLVSCSAMHVDEVVLVEGPER